MSASQQYLAPPEPAPVPWRAREGIYIYLLMQLLLLPVAVVVSPDTAPLLAMLLGQPLLGLMTYAWVRLRYGATLADLGLRGFTFARVRAGISTALTGLLLGYGVSTLAVFLIRRLGDGSYTPPSQLDLDAEPSFFVQALLVVVVVAITPIVEEMFFRGFLYRALRGWVAVWPATLISALIFGLAHIQPVYALATFVLGILLARVVEREQSIVPAVVAHMLFNGVGMAVLLFTT